MGQRRSQGKVRNHGAIGSHRRRGEAVASERAATGAADAGDLVARIRRQGEACRGAIVHRLCGVGRNRTRGRAHAGCDGVGSSRDDAALHHYIIHVPAGAANRGIGSDTETELHTLTRVAAHIGDGLPIGGRRCAAPCRLAAQWVAEPATDGADVRTDEKIGIGYLSPTRATIVADLQNAAVEAGGGAVVFKVRHVLEFEHDGVLTGGQGNHRRYKALVRNGRRVGAAEVAGATLRVAGGNRPGIGVGAGRLGPAADTRFEAIGVHHAGRGTRAAVTRRRNRRETEGGRPSTGAAGIVGTYAPVVGGAGVECGAGGPGGRGQATGRGNNVGEACVGRHFDGVTRGLRHCVPAEGRCGGDIELAVGGCCQTCRYGRSVVQGETDIDTLGRATRNRAADGQGVATRCCRRGVADRERAGSWRCNRIG